MNKLPEYIAELSQSVQKLWSLMNPCTLCPRNCGVNRSEKTGYCGIGASPVVSSVGPHFGEESVLVGSSGSGTIFFAGCNLRCIFCQNYDISHQRRGKEITVKQLSEAMLSLAEQGCTNINLVTPSHVASACAAAIEIARKDGLTLPVVYNSGGYDSVETLKLLDGLIDIYMPDMKYSDQQTAGELSDAPNYPEVNFAAVKEMHRQVGDLEIENGIAVKGLLIRHLVLPENLAGSEKIIDFLADEISTSTAINIMDQYHPCYKADEHPKLNRRADHREISDIYDYAALKGLKVIS
ncbi:MAG: radical SAM protein [Sedimentisphaerales bacterium]|nr:radical SAM protein [Sedimentisphaerales bacterium]